MLQEVTITNLVKNPGVLPYKLGSAKVKSEFHTFIHYYDLEPIKQEIRTIEHKYYNITRSMKGNQSQMNLLDQITLTLNLLLHLLSNIENTVTFARLGTLHSSIIKIDELETILDTVLKYFSVDHLLFRDTNRFRTFSYYHLFSIPTQNSTTVIPKNTYLVMNENFYQYMSAPCVKLHPNYYCPFDNLVCRLIL
ncbi:hypothetical protein NQ315_015387 [Exocentrus adspersus]|uniref:Uncharacterized protein n=1 Tax=Exocentrus adspersus TaxID=1586481 RepID=A0AAV8VKA7_9CUCU|nr:hypothetical protein NQ315_015387 [Exocentrus adspersus]